MRTPSRYWSLIVATSLGAACSSGACSSPATGPTTTGNPSSSPTTPLAPAAPAPPATPTTPVPQGPTFVAGSFEYGGKVFPYQVFVPSGFDRSRKWPVVVSMGGSGEMGSDNALNVQAGLPAVVRARPSAWPAVMFFPQVPNYRPGAPTVGGRPNATRAEFLEAYPRLLDHLMQEYSGDPDRVVITGWSMGGLLHYELAYADPTRYAGFLPISAVICSACVNGTDQATQAAPLYATFASRLRQLPILHYHGVTDAIVRIEWVRQMKAAFDASQSRFTLVEVPGMGHDYLREQVYADAKVQQWLLSQRRQ